MRRQPASDSTAATASALGVFMFFRLHDRLRRIKRACYGEPMRSVLAAELLDGVDGLARSFRAAEPFKHVVLDPLLAPELARGLAAEFRAPASGELRARGPAFQPPDDTLR